MKSNHTQTQVVISNKRKPQRKGREGERRREEWNYGRGDKGRI